MKVNAKAIFLVAILVIAIVASILVVYLNSIEKGKNFELGDFTVTSESNGISLVSYNGDSTIFKVPAKIEGKKVVSIGAGAFNDSNVTKIIFDESTKDVKLAEKAFAGNTKLQTVELPANLEYIPKYCFNGCTALLDVKFPENIKYIGDYAFYGCSEFTKEYAQEGTNNYRYLNIPEKVEEICSYAFHGCSQLDAIRISTDLTTIGAHAFRESALQKIETYETDDIINIETIGDYAFYKTSVYSKSSNELYMPKLKTIGSYAFASVINNFEYIRIAPSVEKIGDFAFSGCTLLNQVIFEQEEATETLELGKSTFAYCARLKKVAISDKITKIPAGMFMGCITLLSTQDLVLSEATEEIGEGAFALFATTSTNTKSLSKTIKFKHLLDNGNNENVSYNDNFRVSALNNYWSGTVSATEKSHFILTDYEGKTLYAYVGMFADETDSYAMVDGNKSYSFKELMNSEIETIANYAFAGAMFSKLIMPANVKTICANAFNLALVDTIYFDQACILTQDTITIDNDAFKGMKKSDINCFVIGTSYSDRFAESNLQKALNAFDIVLEPALMPN